MTNTDKKTIASLSVLATVAVFGALTLRSLSNEVVERFPNVDPKTARQAYRNMLKKSARGEYTGIAAKTDAENDAIFLNEVRLINAKK